MTFKVSLMPSLMALWAVWLVAAGCQCQPNAKMLRNYSVPEARQGVAVDENSFYAVDNSRIAKYDRETGRKIGEWNGDRWRIAHLNSCVVVGSQLVCANSNYPNLPMTSSVEFFDPVRLVHLRTISLGELPGSLTWVQRHEDAWWAGLGNYDGRGGAPGRDHRATALVKFDDRWRVVQTWTFPENVLARLKPNSASGGSWGRDGSLYITGHDRPEVYVLALPKQGLQLKSIGTIRVPFRGQAIAFDPARQDVLFGIDRRTRTVMSVRTSGVWQTKSLAVRD